MDTKNTTVPVGTLAKVLKNYAMHSTSPVEKHCIFTVTEELGAEIKQITPGFNEQEFQRECGVKPEWATAAA